MWWAHNGDFSGWWWLWMSLGFLWMGVFWGSVIAVAVWAVRRFSNTPPTGTNQHHSPLDIAQKRYASGEITREEYQQIQQDLKANKIH